MQGKKRKYIQKERRRVRREKEIMSKRGREILVKYVLYQIV